MISGACSMLLSVLRKSFLRDCSNTIPQLRNTMLKQSVMKTTLSSNYRIVIIALD